MDDENALGTLIRQARLDKGLSFLDLASIVGRSSTSIRRWERGVSTPSPRVIDDLAGALDLDAGDLTAMVAEAHGSVDDGTASQEAAEDVEDIAEVGVSALIVPEPMLPDPPGAEIAVESATGPIEGGAVDVPVRRDDDPDKTVDVPSLPPELTTLEDEAAVVEVAHYFEQPESAEAAVVVSEPSPWEEWFAAIWGRRDLWIGWVRGILTALALLFLFLGLIWALGELWDALKGMSGSFSTGA